MREEAEYHRRDWPAHAVTDENRLFDIFRLQHGSDSTSEVLLSVLETWRITFPMARQVDEDAVIFVEKRILVFPQRARAGPTMDDERRRQQQPSAAVASFPGARAAGGCQRRRDERAWAGDVP